MATLIPAYSICEPNMKTGEKRLARRLESFLDDSSMCWFDIPVGNKRRYPDFIVLNPDKGILFLEVKDWKIKSIVEMNSQTVTLDINGMEKRVTNPLEQARQCSYTVVNELALNENLLSKNPKYKNNLCFPYAYGVVLPFITRKELDEYFSNNNLSQAKNNPLPGGCVICSDEMTESRDPESFKTQLWGMFSYSFNDPLSQEQVDHIRGVLFPEIRIANYQQGELFNELTTLDVDGQQGGVNMIKVMDIQQELLARSMGEGHRVIHGVAGSGKTLILGYRCLYLAAIVNKPILVICYNVTLAAKLRSFIKEHKIDDKVEVKNFHSWCREQGKKFKVKSVEEILSNKDKTNFYENLVDAVICAVDNNEIPKEQYAAILIDEGHDFEESWLRLVTKMVDSSTNSLLLLYDDAQSIYKKKNTLDFSLASVGIQAQGRTTILKLNYRNTREILKFSYNFAKNYFDGNKEKELPVIEPESAGNIGLIPTVRKCDDLRHEANYVMKCLNGWLDKGKRLQDIAILYPMYESVEMIIKKLNDNNIHYQLLNNSHSKKNYDPNLNAISIMPTFSSKGLEFDTVVMIDSSFLNVKEEEGTTAKLMYVGFTRATNILLTTYHRKNNISEMLEVAYSA